MHLRHVLFRLLVGLVLSAPLSLAAQTLLWEQQIDLGASDTVTALEARSGRVFLTAFGFSDTANLWTVRAFDRDGVPLWQEHRAQTRRADGHVPQAQPLALDASPDTLIVGGAFRGFVVRAYDARTGAVRWQDRLRGTGEATTVLLSPQAVYAGGMWQGRALLRAYGLDGTLLWQCRSAAPGEAIQSLHLARAQGADATLFAVRRNGQVQAFRADGGQRRWRVPARPGTVILTATRTPTLLLLAGFADGDWSVQALDLATGQERWRVRDADPAGVAWATTLVVGDHVYVGGGFLQGLTRTIVRAYDAVTGAEVWEAMGAEFADADEGENIVTSLALDATQTWLYAGSEMLDAFGTTPQRGHPDLFVRRYDAQTGAPQTAVQVDGPAQLWDGARALAVTGQRVYVAGFVNKMLFGEGLVDVVLQAYTPPPPALVGAVAP